MLRNAIFLAAALAAITMAACGGSEDSSEVKGNEASEPPGGPRKVKLAAVKLDDGREVELRSSLSPNAASDFPPCLKILGIDEQTRACGRPPSEVTPPITRPVVAQAVAQSGEQAPLEVYGATGADVAELRVIHTVGGSSKRASATLLQVADSEILNQARIGEPFTYFLAELPSQASNVRAIALDAAGEQLGSDDFDRYMGEARRQAFIEGPY